MLRQRSGKLVLAVLLALSAPMAAVAGEHSAKQSSGVSAERLGRLDDVMRRHVDEGKVAGTVVYVARAGKVVHLKAYGSADIEAARTMKPDTIFRIASQTKAFTSVAAMMLVEEGRLTLLDPVSDYIPEFANTTVAVPRTGGGYDVVPAKRKITVKDLLTQTAGIPYGLGVAQDRWKAADIQNWYFADRDEPVSAVVARMGALPMDAQPGERFVYGYGTDILGVVVERASGMSLDRFFQERLIDPLGLKDTSFYLPPAKRDRLAQMYSIVNGRVEVATDPKLGFGHYVDGPRKAFSGGAGLLSTASDYGRFLEMLRRGGELDGKRYLSPKTVALMTANHVGTKFADTGFTDGATGFGLGFEVVDDLGRAGRFSSAGTYSWGGAYHTTYWVDPEEQLVAILLTQLRPSTGSRLHTKFQALVYQAIVGAP